MWKQENADDDENPEQGAKRQRTVGSVIKYEPPFIMAVVAGEVDVDEDDLIECADYESEVFGSLSDQRDH